MGRRSSLREHFGRAKTPIGSERFKVQKFRFWSCFKSAENRARSSLWVGGLRYASILRLSKLLWVQSWFKLENLATATKSLSDFVWVIVGADLQTHLPKPKYALTSAGDARCKVRDPSGGAWGGGSPPNVSTPFPSWLNWTEPKWSDSKSCFKSAENQAASSL